MDLNLSSLITPALVKLSLAATKKRDVLAEMVELLAAAGKVTDAAEYLKSVVERESLGSTGIGMGIAIPHGKSDVITDVVIAFGRSTAGIDFEALDDKPVHLVFLLAAPRNVGGVYLKALAQLSRMLRRQDFRQNLMNASTEADVIAILTSGEAER